MARPRKHDKHAKRESPVQFRLESDLGRLVRGFADRHSMGVNEAAKSLIALSAVALDCRHYALIRQMANRIGGSNAFVSACMRVHASLEGVAMGTGQTIIPEAERQKLISRVAEGVFTDEGSGVGTSGLDLMAGNSGPTEIGPKEERETEVKRDEKVPKRRTIRRITE